MTFRDLDALAVRICDCAAAAWWDRRGHGEAAVPLGVIAALCLADGIDAKALLAATDEEIVRGMGLTWARFWLRRPDLCIRCGPLADWLNDDPPDPELVRAAVAVARAAVKAGICDLFARDVLQDVDLLGHAYIAMRPRSAVAARGEFYTPPAVCDALARMTLTGDLRPGMSIAEPAAGTGGMLRAAAQVLRERGQDPGDYWWVVNDISPVVTAALAVNCHLWGLGGRVVIRAADTLTELDWPDSAWAEQRAAVGDRDALRGAAAMMAIIRHAERLVTEAAGDEPAAQPAPLPVSGPRLPGTQANPGPGSAIPVPRPRRRARRPAGGAAAARRRAAARRAAGGESSRS